MKDNILTTITLSRYVVSLIMFIMICNVFYNGLTDDLYVESLKVQDKSVMGLVFQYFLIVVAANIISGISHSIMFSSKNSSKNSSKSTSKTTSPEDDEVDRKIEESEKRLSDLKTKLKEMKKEDNESK